MLTNNIDSINAITQNVLLNTLIGLLGLLGFIVSGLAIIAGTIGNKAAYQMDRLGKFESLISILFSFYYIGFVIGILIFIYFVSFFVFNLNIAINIWGYLLVEFVLSYGFFFAVFYSVSLLGTSLHIFVINYLYSKEDESVTSINNHISLINHKIDTLTYILVSKLKITQEEFYSTLIDCINKDCPVNNKEEILKMVKEYYK
ncbi:hypothetical protein [Candidatus Formimonas warabiya]|uniref:hypothetical protein n=1 Tax=Formimonas warabiya TaxID=1761012 RepID=UPI001BE4BEEE|nr:hypothetical protein [Candidatus Formimonas warabiya]